MALFMKYCINSTSLQKNPKKISTLVHATKSEKFSSYLNLQIPTSSALPDDPLTSCVPIFSSQKIF